jgi:protein-glutamine gamma-glutamyltransferase
MPASSPALDRPSREWTLVAAAACLLPLLPQLPPVIAWSTCGIGLLTAALSWRTSAPSWLRLVLAAVLLTVVLWTMGIRIGRDTGCALLAAMLALKPLELRTLRDGRSLVGFALFAPFATFLLDQGPSSLLLGLVGAVLALMALSRLADQQSRDPHPSRPRDRVIVVLRLLATGLPLALAAFWLFPRISTPLWGVPERALTRPGLSEVMSPGDWIDLMGDDRPALRVVFNGPSPPLEQMYWRGPVLMDFDGRDWTRSQWLRGLPPAEVSHSTTTWRYLMEVEPTDQRILVALESAGRVPEGAALSWDHTLTADRPLSSVTRWNLQASPPTAFEPRLPALVRQAALHLPEGYNPRTLELAGRWREETGPGNDVAIVERAMRMIRDEFGYTLDTPLPGRHTADEFLFDWKRGYCEHFSSAFVVLMRAAGVPARVVTGYAGGYRNRFGNYWVVRRMDAHAWAEVWLPGRGWVRVDPTAAVAPERIYDTLDDRLGAGGFSALRPALDAGDWMRRGWNDLVLSFDAERQRDLFRPFGGGALGTAGLAGLFALAAVLALGWMLWLSARGARQRDPVLRAWRRLGARYARVGLGRAMHEPPLRWLERVRPALDGGAADELAALTRRFVESRYASAAAAPVRPLVRDLRRHRPGRIVPRESTP